MAFIGVTVFNTLGGKTVSMSRVSVKECFVALLILCMVLPAICQSIVVRVDGVSKGVDSDIYGTQPHAAVAPTTTNVRVSDGKSTYQLTCNLENKTCVGPALGADYQLVAIPGDKPEDLDDHEGEYPHRGKAAFLKRANVTLGPYWMVAQMPAIHTSTFRERIAECGEREQGLNENDCTKWLARRAWLRKAACPDSEAAVACHSFQQLLDAADPDLLDLLARIEHVYTCFRPHEDVFFDLFFSEPSEWHWGEADADNQKVFGLQSGALMQFGAPGIYYYDKGVQDKRAGISGTGVWSFLPMRSDITPSSLALVATSNDAKFRGKEFQIDGTRVEASETYESKSDKQIKHTVIVQRSTGRFTETYDEDPSGDTVLRYEGQCLVVPNATD